MESEGASGTLLKVKDQNWNLCSKNPTEFHNDLSEICNQDTEILVQFPVGLLNFMKDMPA